MDRIRLIKWNDEECKSRGWEAGLQHLAVDTGISVEELASFWWVDDESIEYGVPPEVGKLEDVTGYVIIRDRVYPSAVKAVVVSRTDNEMIVETEDANSFF